MSTYYSYNYAYGAPHRGFRNFLTISGTDYYGPWQGFGGSMQWYVARSSWAVNPATGQPWTAADVNVIQFMGLAGYTQFGYHYTVTQAYLEVIADVPIVVEAPVACCVVGHHGAVIGRGVTEG